MYLICERLIISLQMIINDKYVVDVVGMYVYIYTYLNS